MGTQERHTLSVTETWRETDTRQVQESQEASPKVHQAGGAPWVSSGVALPDIQQQNAGALTMLSLILAHICIVASLSPQYGLHPRCWMQGFQVPVK